MQTTDDYQPTIVFCIFVVAGTHPFLHHEYRKHDAMTNNIVPTIIIPGKSGLYAMLTVELDDTNKVVLVNERFLYMVGKLYGVKHVVYTESIFSHDMVIWINWKPNYNFFGKRRKK